MTTDSTTHAKGTGQYALVNGINLYYDTHGSGRPLILLHGGLGSGEMFAPVLPVLAARHQVIAVDLQGHGRTADIDRPLDVRLMAGDIAALIDHLELAKPDVVGYSLGAGVAFQTAVMYPAKVRRLVMVSANIRRDAIYPEMRAQQGQINAAAIEFLKDMVRPAGTADTSAWPPTLTWLRPATTSKRQFPALRRTTLRPDRWTRRTARATLEATRARDRQ